MTGLALDAYLAAVGLHHLLDDGQSQTAATGCACARGIGAIEALEDIRQVLFLDATAAIAHTEIGRASCRERV